MLNQIVHSCSQCGATLKPLTSSQPVRCNYCGTELAISLVLPQPPAPKSTSTLPPELASLKRPKVSVAASMGGLSILLFAIPWTLCILLGFFTFGSHFLNEFINYARLSNEGVTVQGTVINLVVDSSDDSTVYNVSYRFSAPVNGDYISHEDIDGISESVYNKLKMGGNVDIIYIKSDPKISAIEADWGSA